ncbi:hypothetical protein, partial [Listeria monocytogenes]
MKREKEQNLPAEPVLYMASHYMNQEHLAVEKHSLLYSPPLPRDRQ